MTTRITCSILFILFLFNVTFAQPILTGNVVPNIGDAVYLAMSDSNSMQPGNPGINQTWNFSSLSPLSAATLYSYISPVGTPYSANYPTANMALKWTNNGEDTYAYLRKDASQFTILGSRNSSYNQTYVDSDAQLKFPTNYNGIYEEAYSYITDSGSGFPFLSTGTHSVKYDAYGTMVTPLGTFPNTMRIKALTIQKDSANFFGNEIINHHDYITYDWLVANQPGALVSVTYFHTITETRYPGIDTIITETGPTKTVTFISSGSVATFDAPALLSGLADVSVGPNPAIDQLTLRFTAENSEEILVKVLDVSGKVWQTEMVNSIAGDNNHQLSVAGLPSGMYYLTLGSGRSVQIRAWQKM